MIYSRIFQLDLVSHSKINANIMC